MFDLFKPKEDAAIYGRCCGQIFGNYMNMSSINIARHIEEIVAVGASTDRIRPELAIFSAFTGWVGMAAALQSKRITEDQFERMDGAYRQELETSSELMSLQSTGSVSYSTVFEWMKARLDRYERLITTTEPALVNQTLIEHFCDFAFDGEPSIEAKRLLKNGYEVCSLLVRDKILKARLI